MGSGTYKINGRRVTMLRFPFAIPQQPLTEEQPVHLCEEFRGQVVLIVNTASKCGFTPQYEGLQKLYEEKKDQGFTIVGFPANDFASSRISLIERGSSLGVTAASFLQVERIDQVEHAVGGTDAVLDVHEQLAARGRVLGHVDLGDE